MIVRGRKNDYFCEQVITEVSSGKHLLVAEVRVYQLKWSTFQLTLSDRSSSGNYS